MYQFEGALKYPVCPDPQESGFRARQSVALALSSGGARGAYQIGCWRALKESGFSFCAISGTSIGALNGALICQNDWEAAFGLWMELTERSLVRVDYRRIGKLALAAATDIGLLFLPVPKFGFLKYASFVCKVASRHGALGFLRNSGVFDLTDIRPLLGEYLEMEKVVESPIPFFVSACGPPDALDPLGPLCLFRVQEYGEEEAWRIVTGSMSIPFVFSSILIGGKLHNDGGLKESLPLLPLYQMGVRRIIGVSMRPDMKCKAQDYPGAEISIIKPRKSFGRFPLATFRFTKKAVLEWMDQGYEDAMRFCKEHPRWS